MSARGSLVLLVDDEQLLLLITERILLHLGYAVLRAESGEEALASLACSGARPDLLITDIGLRGMDGRAVADALRAGTPGLPVLFMSGRGDLASVSRTLHGDGRAAVLAKPFTRDQLAAAVAALLAPGD